MGETVYADVLFIINFSMDFLCFYICSRVLGYPLRLGCRNGRHLFRAYDMVGSSGRGAPAA